MSALVDDPEARLDYLIEHGALVERPDGTITTSQAFQADLEVYEDTYLDASEETFAETVASVFGLAEEEATERIEATGVTRRELATFLALRSYLDDSDLSRDEVVLMAAMAAEVGAASAVPPELTELTDDTYGAFVEEHGDVVVFVFTRNCRPCDALKADLPTVVEDAPEGVSFAGVHGDEASAFRRAFEVSMAPTTLVFAGGEPVERFEGHRPAETLIDSFEAVYGSANGE